MPPVPPAPVPPTPLIPADPRRHGTSGHDARYDGRPDARPAATAQDFPMFGAPPAPVRDTDRYVPPADRHAPHTDRYGPPGPGARGPHPEVPEEHTRPARPRLMAALIVAAAVLLAWDASTFVDSGMRLSAVLTSLAPVVSLAALPIVAVAGASRQWVPAGMAVVAAVVPWAMVFGSSVAGPGPTTTEDQRNVLRVMTVHGQGASAPSIVRTVRSHQADVLVVTGMDSTLAHDLTVAGLNSMLAARWITVEHGGDGIGLYSAVPASAAQMVPGTDGRSVTGSLTVGATELSFTVAHAGGGLVPASTWHGDLAALRANTRDTPRLLAGELGASPWHPAVRGLASGPWRDAADVLGRGLRPTWPSWSPLPLVPLEQVLVGGGVGVQSAESTPIAGTSYRALVVAVILPGSRSPKDT